ncbi:MAG: methyltransferase domain-containing protein [Pirellulales bacterium]|nr:methyltransferase domain-containing protein [Pirellulales bacterium]
MSRLTEYRIFFREFRRNFHTTGSITPSSGFLAKALARFVNADQSSSAKGQRILEVGPGTGAVTSRIVRQMSSEDTLDLCELNDSFVATLKRRFEIERAFQRVAARHRILHQMVQDMPEDAQYDIIISGLPLNNFSGQDVDDILWTFRRLLAPGGVLSFFEYVAVRPVRSVVGTKPERARIKKVGELLHDLLSKHEIKRDLVLLNVPPAWAHHIQISEASSDNLHPENA